MSVRVGIGVWIKNSDGAYLVGLRLSKHGTGTWAPPGGHLEFGESFEQCAVREVAEETAIQIDPTDVQIIGVTNDIFESENSHYVTIHCMVEKFSGTPKIMEPDKCKQWQWCKISQMPDNLFVPAKNFLKNLEK